MQKHLKLAVKILLKTMDATTPSADRLEISFMRLAEDGKTVVYTTLSEKEVNGMII